MVDPVAVIERWLRIQQNADATYAFLRNLDPSEPQRAELLAAGISLKRVDFLYPEDFTILVPPLIEHLRSLEPRGALSDALEGELNAIGSALVQLNNALPEELGAQRNAAWHVHDAPFPLSKLGRALRAEVDHLLGDKAGGPTATEMPSSGEAYTIASRLWHTWWYMGQQHRGVLLPDENHDVEFAASWFGVNLLQLPGLSAPELFPAETLRK